MSIGEWPVRPSACPQCGEILDCASHVTDVDVIPRPGDITICVRCGQISKFDALFLLTKLKRSEFHALPDEAKTELFKASHAIAKMNGKKHTTVIVDEDEDRPPKDIEVYAYQVKKKEQ